MSENSSSGLSRRRCLFTGVKSDHAASSICRCSISDLPAVAVGVYTQNVGPAAHRCKLNRSNVPPATRVRAVVINSGSCPTPVLVSRENETRLQTRCATRVAQACGLGGPEQVLVMSTGVIGEHVADGQDPPRVSTRQQRNSRLSDRRASADRCRRPGHADDGHATQDSAAGEIQLEHGPVHESPGLAKGAAMIGPNMATMLAVMHDRRRADESKTRQAGSERRG